MTLWASLFERVVPLLAVLTPLVGAPLTVITFYLRSLREQQSTTHAELMRRLDAQESCMVEFRRAIHGFERDYATKEEWLRECMQTRRTLSHLTETTIRLEAFNAASQRRRSSVTSTEAPDNGGEYHT